MFSTITICSSMGENVVRVSVGNRVRKTLSFTYFLEQPRDGVKFWMVSGNKRSAHISPFLSVGRPERKDWKLDLRVNENTELEIFAEENPPKRVNRPEACGLRHLAFCVESVKQTVKELAEVGIECEPIRVDDYTGKKMTFFHDLDGLPMELHMRSSKN